MNKKNSILILVIFGFVSCTPTTITSFQEDQSWKNRLLDANGTTVNMAMWGGDPMINQYMNDFIIPHLKDHFNIQLDIAYAQGNTIVSQIMAEKVAKSLYNSYDLVWINGETFYQLRQLDALMGNWTSKLPNARYVDFDNPYIGIDFNQPIEEYECPWGSVQFTLIYNNKYIENPPLTRAELLQFVKKYPGKFTFDMGFTGLTLLKSWLIDFSGSPNGLKGPYNPDLYQKLSKQLWDFVFEIQPYLWKKGLTFPESVSAMHQLFSSEELWITMSNNHTEVDNKFYQGVFSQSARAYVPEYGSIRNAHYLGIPIKASNPVGAMIVTNFLISPKAQFQKADPLVWGDGTVLKISSLPDSLQSKFDNIPHFISSPDINDPTVKALSEPAPEYMIKLAEDFRKVILKQE
ncbi:MAG: ABC transporter substrate-binding protein [Saprospiraceae bacterium]